MHACFFFLFQIIKATCSPYLSGSQVHQEPSSLSKCEEPNRAPVCPRGLFFQISSAGHWRWDKRTGITCIFLERSLS